MSITINASNFSVIANQSNKSGLSSEIERHTDEQLGSLQLFQGYPEPLLKFTAICCMLFMVIGIPGNLVTILALTRCKKVRNATAMFIINLSFSDLLNCCFNLPLAASTFWTKSWPHGALLCQIFPSCRYALAAVSLFSVLAITINRYIMISHPRHYPRLYTTRNLIIMIVCIWIISWTSLIATWVEAWGRFGMNTKTFLCDVIPDRNGASPMTALFLMAFVIPCVAIIFCYGRIFCIVKKAAKKSQKNGQTNRRSVIDDTSFETSTAMEKARDSENETERYVPPGHPRVESLRTHTSSPLTAPDKNPSRTYAKGNIAAIAQNIRKSMYLTKLHVTTKIKPTSKDKRLLSMITAIMISFFICHLPITIIKVSTVVSATCPSAYLWSYILRFLTTCINPVIYVVMSQEYRKAYKKVFLLKSWNVCRFWT